MDIHPSVCGDLVDDIPQLVAHEGAVSIGGAGGEGSLDELLHGVGLVDGRGDGYKRRRRGLN